MRRQRQREGFRLLHGVYTDRDGSARECPKWVMEFRDALETTRKLTLFTSKSASEGAARSVVRLVADVQALGKVNDSDLLRWIGGLPLRMRR